MSRKIRVVQKLITMVDSAKEHDDLSKEVITMQQKKDINQFERSKLNTDYMRLRLIKLRLCKLVDSFGFLDMITLFGLSWSNKVDTEVLKRFNRICTLRKTSWKDLK